MEGIESRQPEILFTKTIKYFVKDVLAFNDINKTTRDELEPYLFDKNEKKTIPFRLVKIIHQKLNETGNKKIYLHTIVEDSDLHLSSVIFPPRNPELEARIQKLKAQQANREYREMTKNVDRMAQDTPLNFQKDIKEVNRQLVSVFNFLVTVGGAFVFGYKATEYATGPNAFALQMMVGLVFGTVVFFADLWFLVRYGTQ
ncbi:transmembrane protein 199-like [Gigantopelta aegis]|uniref:transmembrane protein 199-like n=1 Tax=Gigantopelta aegis TaxID=1735272 RepID=UPI001B88DB60|nr:transmembrane protein 199-like [Gigantopelta aegis]